MSETVILGCRLPNGIVLEVGLQTTVKGGPQGRPIENLKRLDSYMRLRIGGTHDHTREMRKAKIQMPAMLNPPPFITRNVPKALWDEWKRTHPGSWFIRSGNLFEVKDEKDLPAILIDSAARPVPLAPIDATKSLVVGVDKLNLEE